MHGTLMIALRGTVNLQASFRSLFSVVGGNVLYVHHWLIVRVSSYVTRQGIVFFCSDMCYLWSAPRCSGRYAQQWSVFAGEMALLPDQSTSCDNKQRPTLLLRAVTPSMSNQSSRHQHLSHLKSAVMASSTRACKADSYQHQKQRLLAPETPQTDFSPTASLPPNRRTRHVRCGSQLYHTSVPRPWKLNPHVTI